MAGFPSNWSNLGTTTKTKKKTSGTINWKAVAVGAAKAAAAQKAKAKKPAAKPSNSGTINWKAVASNAAKNATKTPAAPAARFGGLGIGGWTKPVQPAAPKAKVPAKKKESVAPVARAATKRVGDVAAAIKARLSLEGGAPKAAAVRAGAGNKGTKRATGASVSPSPDPLPASVRAGIGGPGPDPSGAPGRGAAPAPVGGGTGSTGGSAGAPGTALGAGTGKMSETDKVFAPILAELKAQKDRDEDLRLKAEANVKAFNDWMSGTLGKSQDFYTNAVTQSQQLTSNALQGIGANIGKYSGGYGQGMEQSSGLAGAQAIEGLRAGRMASDAQMSDNVQRAIAARIADNSKVAAAQSAGMASDIGARFDKRAEDWGARNTATLFEIAKAKLAEQQAARQAEIDRVTAESLAGDRAFGRWRDVQRLNLDTQRANTDAAYKAQQIGLRKAELRAKQLAAKSKAKGKSYKDFSDVAASIRKNAAGGQYDGGKLTIEQQDAVIGNALARLTHVAAGWELPPSYVTWAMYDIFGQKNVQRALAAAKAASAAGTVGP